MKRQANLTWVRVSWVVCAVVLLLAMSLDVKGKDIHENPVEKLELPKPTRKVYQLFVTIDGQRCGALATTEYNITYWVVTCGHRVWRYVEDEKGEILKL
jgi:hypothetical protein